ncbi:class I SAM-dependent methyltransferase [Nocardioidaceae bacterium]|nr:class I SAM-dependent methyltransferase [Nocardioidaceae bacterium]
MSGPHDLPAIVQRAFDLSRRSGFVSFCRNETGRLLASLAASRQGTLAEIGTGTGVGAAWLRSGLAPGAHLVTAELDARLADTAAGVFAGDPQVEVLAADWQSLVERGPFSLLFCDSSLAEASNPATLAELVEPGGVVVVDDFVATTTWPPLVDGRVDTLRQAWLTHPDFVASQVLVTEDAAVVIASRR